MAKRHLFDPEHMTDIGIRCKARTKVCRKCGYRYARGDKSWDCPMCGFDRRCRNACKAGNVVCRMHGAQRYAMPSKADKHYIATNISRAYNRILNNPEILNLTQEIAMLGTQITMLQMRIQDEDPTVALMLLKRAESKLEEAIFEQNMVKAKAALRLLYQSNNRTLIINEANREIREVMELQRKLVAQEQSWFKEQHQNIPVAQVVELLVAIQAAVLKYLPNPHDRAAFLSEIKTMVPTQEDLRRIQAMDALSKHGNGATALLPNASRTR